MCAFCVRVPGAAGRVALRGDSEGMASKLRELLGAGGGGGAGAPCAGGALLRLLHERRRALVGDPEGAALLDFLLQRAAVPFFDMLQAWVYRGVCHDPYAQAG